MAVESAIGDGGGAIEAAAFKHAHEYVGMAPAHLRALLIIPRRALLRKLSGGISSSIRTIVRAGEMGEAERL